MSDAEKKGNHDENAGGNPPPLNSADTSLTGSIDPKSIEGVFLRAVQINVPSERESFLDEQCNDQDERRRVTALLRAYDDAGSFLETPAGKPLPQDELPLDFLERTDDDCLGLIGPYRVLEVIGCGGMGIVLRALDPKLNRIVAVKVLLPELARRPNARRRFLREAQAAAAISHPHVVTIHAVEEAQPDADPPQPPFLVMECVVGHSLQQKLDAVGTLRLAEILRISRQMAEGLAAAHQQGLIHRDIKPANILLENGVQRVKITDFGLARAADDLSVTMTGEVSGTPQYMSPEQATGKLLDQRSDLFSLGCVMYAMCTGHSPFRANNLAHIIQRVTQDTPRPITDQNPEIPNWLAQVIACLLEKSPDHRIQSAQGLVAILDQHLSRLQQPAQSGSHSLINRVLPTTAEVASAKANGRRGSADAQRSQPTPTHFVTEPNASPRSASHLSLAETPPQRVGHFVLTLLAALFLGGALSFATISSNMLQTEMQRVEQWLIAGLIIAAGCAAIFSLLIYLKHGSDTKTKLRVLQTVMVLGTIDAGYTWATFIRSSAASVHDYRALGFLTLLWAIFCLYVGKVWAETERQENATRFIESLHGRVGRYLIAGGVFCILLPLALIVFGLVLSDGDVMQAGGQFLFAAGIFSTLAIIAGYILRYIIDTHQDSHRPLGLWLVTLLAVCTAMGGSLVHAIVEQRGRVDQQTVEVVSAIPKSPSITITHPRCVFRVVSINGGGSSRVTPSETETRLILKPETLGTRINLYLILEDGREYVRYGFAVERLLSSITIDEDDLRHPHRALVEVIEDAPGVKLRMVKYPTQKVTNNEFSINSAPFHKLMQPGEHRIVLDFVRDEWDLPENEIQYQTLDYRVQIPDSRPLTLSLREILEEHEDRAKTHRLHWNPDFKPLAPTGGDQPQDRQSPASVPPKNQRQPEQRSTQQDFDAGSPPREVARQDGLSEQESIPDESLPDESLPDESLPDESGTRQSPLSGETENADD